MSARTLEPEHVPDQQPDRVAAFAVVLIVANYLVGIWLPYTVFVLHMRYGNQTLSTVLICLKLCGIVTSSADNVLHWQRIEL